MMWDYSSDRLWEAETGDGVRLEDLPLSVGTRAAMRDWIRRIDETNDALWEAEDDDEDVESPQLRELDAVGRALWLEVRRELAPAYEVGYVPGDRDHPLGVLWAPDGPKEPLPWGSGEDGPPSTSLRA